MPNLTSLNAPRSTSGIRKDKVIPDYYGDRYWANVLAKRIQNFWHKQGFTFVRTWLEEDITKEGTKLYSIRSNITFGQPRKEDVLDFFG